MAANAQSDDIISMISDLEKLTVRDLKEYLRQRGAHISGTKAELLKRARGVEKLGHRPLSEVQAEENQRVEERNATRFTTPLGEKIPEPHYLKKWELCIDNIPEIRSSDLYNYLVLSRNRTFDTNTMKAKRQLKARVFYEDRHVHDIQYHFINNDCSHCYIKCKVIPSIPGAANENKKPDYDVWICVAKVSGQIHSAGCTCSTGEGESCKHIAALLYAVVDISDKKKEGSHASTSSKCKWNMPRKRKLSPKRSQDLVFKKYKFSDSESTILSPKEPKRLDNLDHVTPVDINHFSERLKKCAPNAAFLLTIEQTEKSEDNK